MAKTILRPGPVPTITRAAPQGASSTGETVTVACKLPNGIFIDPERLEEYDEPIIGGGVRHQKRYVKDLSKRVRIYGNARPKGGSANTRIVAGYALTQGVPKEIWEYWVHSNKALPAVENELIFAEATTERAAERAREGRKTRSGLEPLNPKIENDPRVPRPMNPDIGMVTMETEKMKGNQFEHIDDEEAA